MIARFTGAFFLILISVLIALGLVEVAYRYQIVDFYRFEFEALNQDIPSDPERTVLILGDSYSASADGYIDQLRAYHPEIAWYNSSIPGTSAREMALLCSRRIQQVDPDLVILQLYPGNDLFDIRHPWQEVENAPLRKFYWFISDRLWFVKWLNYRFGQLLKSNVRSAEEYESSNAVDFDPKLFSPRFPLIWTWEPKLLDNSLQLANGREQDMQKLLKYIEQIKVQAEDSDVEFLVLIIPDAAQVDETYADRYRMLGAQISSATYENGSFPFYDRLEEVVKTDQILNPLHDIRRSDTGSVFYLSNDPHLAATGQQFIFKLLNEHLTIAKE